MPKRGELYNAMFNGSSSDALMYTCTHLYENTPTIMEDDWINFSALIGKTPEFPYGNLWNQINKSILRFIDAEEVEPKDAMVCTVQLMLLYKRCNTNYQPLTIDVLRKKIIDVFPEKAVLSATGLIKYQPILSILNDVTQSSNSSESDISLFCQRILAGLSKVMSENNYDDIRNSLEYLCKKKLVISLPSLYPCPNMEEAERGEIIWFLWGALLCFYGDKNSSYKYNEVTKDIVFTNYTLFVTHWKKSANKERLGLLWGVPYALNSNVVLEWVYNERIILDKLDTNALEMWNSFVDEEREKEEIVQQAKLAQKQTKNKKQNKPDTLSVARSHCIDNIDILSSFIPRKLQYDVESSDDENSNIMDTIANNNLQVLQQQQYQHDEDIRKQNTNREIYDKQLEKLEQTIPFIRTLYVDKMYTSHDTKPTKSTKSTKSTSKNKKDKQQNSIMSQLETTESLLKNFDSKYMS